MHEMAIAQSVLDIVLDECRLHGIVVVERIAVQVGALAAVVPEALTFCFQVVAQGTPAEKAVLAIETVPVVMHCPLCGGTFSKWKIAWTSALNAVRWCPAFRLSAVAK